MKLLSIGLVLFVSLTAQSQAFPSFGPEIDVSIVGLTFDAMEPFISADGNFLFFNNLNDGENTKLFYASKVNDSTFTFIGEVNGANQTTPPHLDAVPDLDSLNNFYWTSTRNYPAELNNLFHGSFNAGSVTSIGRVHGDFNKDTVGWLVMDHGISVDGQYLYYNNARFDGVCQGPCETELGIAQKLNDSTFNQIPNSDAILQNILDADYIYYAPCISSDDLELYYTRYPNDTITEITLFEICVAVRNSPSESFSMPTVLFSELIADLIEAPTLTVDKQMLYYHRKTIASHKIVMRYRENPVSADTSIETGFPISIYPNPAKDKLTIQPGLNYQYLKVVVLTTLGDVVLTAYDQTEIDIESMPSGTYFLKVEIDGITSVKRFLVE